jgi:hypothetical protein
VNQTKGPWYAQPVLWRFLHQHLTLTPFALTNSKKTNRLVVEGSVWIWAEVLVPISISSGSCRLIGTYRRSLEGKQKTTKRSVLRRTKK